MTNETLELRCVGVGLDAQPLDGGENTLLYKPRDVSVELAVESYSAMRYHGQ